MPHMLLLLLLFILMMILMTPDDLALLCVVLCRWCLEQTYSLLLLAWVVAQAQEPHL